MRTELVFILGASDKIDRYSYQARKMLHDYNHQTILVSPRIKSVEGELVYPDLESAVASNGRPETLTIYVGASVSSGMLESILAAHPKRVIFNPGSENPGLATALKNSGAEVIEGCTLVMLRTGQF
jgi:predicted CoA-binding protein